MKTVLCFGDSNTWGYDPVAMARYPFAQRWTVQLQRLLGDDFHVVEEGQNGRTTVHDDPVEGFKNGLTYLVPCLESHKPVDLVVVMLGTNDLKNRFSKSAEEIARSMQRVIQVIQSSEFGPDGTSPEVLLLAPPPVGRLSRFSDVFAGAPEKSLKLAAAYQALAELRKCHFLDTGGVIHSSDADGIHFDADQLPLLAEAVYERVVTILGR